MRNKAKSKFRRITRSNDFKIVISIIAVSAFIWLLIRLIPDKAAVFYIKLGIEDENVYEIRCEYSLGGVPQGGKSTTNIDTEYPIPRGETIWFEFTRSDFEFPDELKRKQFGISFSFFDKNGVEYPALLRDNKGNLLLKWSGSVGFDKEYEFTLVCGEATDNEY